MNTQHPLNTQIYEEATEWIILHRSADLEAEAKNRFDAWLRESPQHLRAYLEMSTVWEDVQTLNHEWNPNADELIERARAEDNIVPLDLTGSFGVPIASAQAGIQLDDHAQRSTPAVLREASPEPVLQAIPVNTVAASQSARIMKLLAIAALLFVTVGTAWLLYAQRGVYRTDIGEQLTVALSDGSTIQLNSKSKLRVHYTEQQRSIELLQGQALFKVAKDSNRPFIVDTDGTRVRAVGTEFDVYKKAAETRVTVVEGRVAVGPGTPIVLAQVESQSNELRMQRAQPISATATAVASHALQLQLGEVLVSAGEQILIADATPTPELSLPSATDGGTVPAPSPAALTMPAAVPQPANIQAATAWTQQRLVFDFTPLNEVAAEFNRYNRRRLVIDDAALETFNISGSFSSTDPTLLLRFLREQPGILVNETTDAIRISREGTHG